MKFNFYANLFYLNSNFEVHLQNIKPIATANISFEATKSQHECIFSTIPFFHNFGMFTTKYCLHNICLPVSSGKRYKR
jgi:hypothetical protein